jgi:hypothetical protein
MPIAIRMIPTIPAGFTERQELERTAAGNQINDQHHDRDDKQQMDERAAELTDETEEPENQENNEDSPEHMFSFGLVSLASCAEPQVRLFFQNRSGIFRQRRPVGESKQITGGLEPKRLERPCRSSMSLCAPDSLPVSFC